jgi:hypothetical protein
LLESCLLVSTFFGMYHKGVLKQQPNYIDAVYEQKLRGKLGLNCLKTDQADDITTLAVRRDQLIRSGDDEAGEVAGKKLEALYEQVSQLIVSKSYSRIVGKNGLASM